MIIPNSWLIVESGSTIIFIKKLYLEFNVRILDKLLCVFSNGGHVDYTCTTTLQLMPTDIYYDKNGMPNILSLSKVAEQFCVTMDTANESSMLVYLMYNTELEFEKSGYGLYFFETSVSSPK